VCYEQRNKLSGTKVGQELRGMQGLMLSCALVLYLMSYDKQ